MSIWPDDVIGWLTLLGLLLSIIAATFGAVIGFLNKRFKNLEEGKASWDALNGFGDRLNKCESSNERLDGAVEKIEYNLQGFQYKHEQLGREITVVNDSAKELAKSLRSFADQNAKEIRAISESVIRMEGVVTGALKQ